MHASYLWGIVFYLTVFAVVFFIALGVTSAVRTLAQTVSSFDLDTGRDTAILQSFFMGHFFAGVMTWGMHP